MTGSDLKISELVACPSCDYLANISNLSDGERAKCVRCGHFLTEYKVDAIDRVLSFSISSLVLLIVANSYPFLSFKSSGLESVMTLPQTALALYQNGMLDLAFLVATFIILLPAFLLFLLLFLCIPLHFKKPVSWLTASGYLIFILQSWCMVDVFLIGVIVSLVKISSMATVVLGLSFWAYAGFTILFTLSLSNLDRLQCWRAIDHLNSRVVG